MKGKAKTIWFEHADPENPVPLHYEPASLHLPRWYKNLENYRGGSPAVVDGRVDNATVKRCAPVYDALTFGYVALLHTDVFIDYKIGDDGDQELVCNHSFNPAPCVVREYDSRYSLAIDNSFVPVEFTWHIRWQICTEPGSSVLITHPLNRFDLPFITTSGVMDSDSGFTFEKVGAIPFYLKKGFTGIIPAGTPIFQVIPFERQPYRHEVRDVPEVVRYRRIHRWKRHLFNGYRKEYRKTKTFK